MRIRIWFICLLLIAGPSGKKLFAQSLRVNLDGGQLHIASPDFHFFTAEALRQLHNGASVSYVFLARLLGSKNGSPIVESGYRFTVSYDLWEEKYAVTRLDPMPRSVSHLSSSAAERWCLDSIALATDKLAADQSFWVVVEYQVQEAQQAPNASQDSGFTLAGLVDIFSRRSQNREQGGKKEGGPFRLSELRRAGPTRNPERR